jgi:murein DD-endopeptidase MepM/ murein hydrolase activator NlpD
MESLEFQNQGATAATPERVLFPKMHVLMAGALVSVLIAMASFPAKNQEADHRTFALAIPELESSPTDLLVADALDWREVDDSSVSARVFEIDVKSGDTLSSLFQAAGLNDRDMYRLVHSTPQAKNLIRLYPGRKLAFHFDADDQWVSLTHHIDSLNTEIFTSNGKGFDYDRLEKTPDVRVAVRSGIIESSLYAAGMEAGLGEDIIMAVAGIFGWDVDFALDIRRGDSFRILFEEKFLDGQRLGTGDILAAEFTNQNTTFRAVRYVDENGNKHYYTPTGKAMRKAFLRAPLDFRRISSNFNPRRLHPITKTVRPHRGIDYAADRGTPVWAAGDGKVIASGYTEANGNYVVIQHGSDIQTKYLHLHTRGVKVGTRVRQKQVIGTVGSTGYSTAPHLHYEFLLNGVHRDPRTILQKLPKAESIPAERMAHFLAQTQPLVAQLEQVTTLASNEPTASNL